MGLLVSCVVSWLVFVQKVVAPPFFPTGKAVYLAQGCAYGRTQYYELSIFK